MVKNACCTKDLRSLKALNTSYDPTSCLRGRRNDGIVECQAARSRPVFAGYTVMCRRSWEPCFPLSRLLVRLASCQICMDERPGAKLRKPRPNSPASSMTSVSSRTFSLAQQQHTSPSRHRPGQLIEAHSGPLQTRNVQGPILSNAQLSAMRQNPQQQSPPSHPQPQPHPQTAAEQYWAARALKAETLLHAQEIHQKSLKSTLMEQELKRQVRSSIQHSEPRSLRSSSH